MLFIALFVAVSMEARNTLRIPLDSSFINSPDLEKWLCGMGGIEKKKTSENTSSWDLVFYRWESGKTLWSWTLKTQKI